MRRHIVATFYFYSPNAVVDNTLDALPGYMQLLMKQYGEAELSAAIEQSGVSNLTVEMIEQTYLAPAITDIFSMVATVLIFVLFGFLLRAVFSLVSRIFTRKKHKFIRGTNMILGAAMGAVKGTIIAGLIAAVLNIGAPAVNNPQLTDLVNTSAVCSTVAEILK